MPPPVVHWGYCDNDDDDGKNRGWEVREGSLLCPQFCFVFEQTICDIISSIPEFKIKLCINAGTSFCFY